jgi:pimeloyl-ACP methyl ester carboxylesterase
VGLAFDVYGEGPPLVLIHGLGTNRGVWRDSAPKIARERRAIAIDLPGFGGSPPAGDGFDLYGVAAALGEQLPDLAGCRYDLLGHSLGGAVALLIARERPADVRRLILNAPAGFRPRSESLARAVGAAAPILLRVRRSVGERLVASRTARRALLWGALSDASRLSPDRARSMLTASRRTRRLPEATVAAMTADLATELSALETPLGLIWGDRDSLMHGATTDAIRRLCPGAPVEVVPGAGHVAQVERPRLFAGAVDRVLARLAPAVTTS